MATPLDFNRIWTLIGHDLGYLSKESLGNFWKSQNWFLTSFWFNFHMFLTKFKFTRILIDLEKIRAIGKEGSTYGLYDCFKTQCVSGIPFRIKLLKWGGSWVHLLVRPPMIPDIKVITLCNVKHSTVKQLCFLPSLSCTLPWLCCQAWLEIEYRNKKIKARWWLDPPNCVWTSRWQRCFGETVLPNNQRNSFGT